MKNKLESNIFQVNELGEQQIVQMNDLMERYFQGVTRRSFLRDLSRKKLVIVLQDGDDIRGFSTMAFIDDVINGVKIKAIFSGDTIIEREYWGSTSLSSIWLKFVFAMMEHFSKTQVRLFWYLISMGYKTYRYLPVYFRDYYPGVDKKTPAFEKEIIDRLSMRLFKENYDPETGIIRFDGAREKLRSGVADVPQERLLNKYISFFMRKNPGYKTGDELACLTELSISNIKSKFMKLYGKEAKHFKKLVKDCF